MKKILFLAILVVVFAGFAHFSQAVDSNLLIDYPDIPGATKPGATDYSLPELINYIYRFALLACGITAFLSILIGAIKYVTSAGDSSKAGDAKEQITQAILGIIILLCAVLILRTINPDLVNLKVLGL